MRRWIAAAAVAAVLAGGAAAEETPDAAIRGVIQSQIDAFLADDFATAFTYASPMIKRIFGTADRFGGMVRQGYPMVYRPSDVRFVEAREAGGAVFQKVLMRGPAGAYHLLEYEMIPTPDGWQINGVRLLEAAQLGA
ncbi:DUF4864 domain-containing protein [Rhodobacteraceae bacterium CCMM004]|nr:DUF4864 domain-containing protein [Rhodobacteraceae bacterium CCMM004]